MSDINRMLNDYHDPDRAGLNDEVPEDYVPEDQWETVYRRTEDPKLAYLESMLDNIGIPHRRNGYSFHAPIVQVPKEHVDAAWALLSRRLPRRRKTIDDMADDHPFFRGFA